MRSQTPPLPGGVGEAEPLGPRPKLPRLQPPAGSPPSSTSPHTAASPTPSGAASELPRPSSESHTLPPRDSEPGQSGPSSPEPAQSLPPRLGILFTSVVARKLSACLSAAVLLLKSQTVPEGTEDKGETERASLKRIPLSRRLALQLVCSEFGELFSVEEIYTLAIVKSCRYDHCAHWHETTGDSEAFRWQWRLPNVHHLSLEHVFLDDIADLLCNFEDYDSLTHVQMDGSNLQQRDASMAELHFPFLRSIRWVASDSGDPAGEREDHQHTASFFAKLLSALSDPDALEHLTLKYQETMSLEDAEPLFQAIKRFEMLESFAGLRAEVDYFALTRASSLFMTAVDAVNCRASANAKAFHGLRRLGLWEREYEAPFWTSRQACEQRFGSGVEKLFLRMDTFWRWPALEAFPRLRVLHVALKYGYMEPEEEAAFSWSFYSALEELPSLRHLLLTLPLEANEVRLSRVPLETLALDAQGGPGARADLRLGGATERSLRRVLLDEAFGEVLWGEHRLPIDQAQPVKIGRVSVLRRSFRNAFQ